jgi:hypothetical protein
MKRIISSALSLTTRIDSEYTDRIEYWNNVRLICHCPVYGSDVKLFEKAKEENWSFVMRNRLTHKLS